MRRIECIAFSLCLAVSALSRAQNKPIALPLPPGQPRTILLGQSIVPLKGPWKFQIGDSPKAPGAQSPLWATANFDDSQWENVDLSPDAGPASTDPDAEVFQTVPGWTARGHQGYSGFAWYRIHLRVQVKPGEQLAFAGPDAVDDGYQVFYEGRLVGSFGDLSSDPPSTGNYQPRMFALPQLNRADSERFDSGPVDLLIALRVWMHPGTLTMELGPGGLRNAPSLGEVGYITAINQISWARSFRRLATYPFGAIAFAVFAVAVFSLILFDRSDRVYLWIGCVFLMLSALYANIALYYWTPMSGLFSNLITVPLSAFIGAGWTMVWWEWFGRPRPAWSPAAIFTLAFLHAIAALIGLEQFFTVISHTTAAKFHRADLILLLMLGLLLLWIVFQGIRQRGVEGWLVLPAVLLQAFAYFGPEMQFLGIKAVWIPFGIYFDTGFIASLLLSAAVAVLLLRRLMFSLRHQREVALDIKQAQEVQHVLLPENITVPGLDIQTEYRPAREVGGDFFQIVPHPSDGSVLIVAGDVTGKGLQAGMLVAVLVGGIRTAAEHSFEPKEILEALNRRLLGREGAFATCLALRIEINGQVTLANAGHLAPYLNGTEVAMEGALPLGMIPQADFPVSSFQFNEGDTLTLISDGILEAQDKSGQLFGFDRIREFLSTNLTPAALASAAQAFGQNDDISVVSVTRAASA